MKLYNSYMYIIIIQCRMGSTRLPGKILKKLFDKEILLWCYERCCKSKADKVFEGPLKMEKTR